MQIGAGTSPMSSYVAFTRVKKMEDLLIFRPFDRALFTQGDLEGPNLLLKVLRGVHVDWAAVEQKHMPSTMCHGCNTKAFKAEFSEPQWKRRDGKRLCKSCERECSHNGLKKQCKWCGSWHPEDLFEPSAWRKRDPSDLWCNNCQEKRKCRECNEMKVRWEFTDSEWGHAAKPNSVSGRCKHCMKRKQDLRRCSKCEGRFPQAMHFSTKMWRHVKDQHRKCNACSQSDNGSEVKTRTCNVCHQELTQTHFSDQQWYKVAADKRKCAQCSHAPMAPLQRGQWTCVKYDCKKILPKNLFSLWMEDKKKQTRDNTQLCNQCFVEAKHAREALSSSNSAHIQKSR